MDKYDKNYVNLIFELAKTQFKLKDQSTFLGFLWSFLNPVLMLAVLWTVFHYRMGSNVPNYTMYLLVGIVQYTHFSNTTGTAVGILNARSNLTKNAVFPKEIIVISSVIADIFEFVISLILCLVISFALDVSFSASLLFLPIVVVLQILFTLWASLLLSIIHIFIRDIRHIYQVFLRMLFFVTPIFYDIKILGDGIGRMLINMNPLTHLIQFGRMIIIEGIIPSIIPIVLFLLLNIILVFLSLSLFRKFEPTFAEYI